MYNAVLLLTTCKSDGGRVGKQYCCQCIEHFPVSLKLPNPNYTPLKIYNSPNSFFLTIKRVVA